MKRYFILLLTSLMLIGLLGTASMSLEGGGTWTQKADMPTARYKAGAAVVDGKIYVIGGGAISKGIAAVVEEYDPVTDTWTRRADMPTARFGLVAAAVDGIIYAIGGWVGGSCPPTVEAYDPATDTWTKKADMPTVRYMPAIAVMDGKIYVIGGAGVEKGDIEILSTVEAYDPATDKWTKKTDMPTARYVFAACVVDRHIYVPGGKVKVDPQVCVPTVEVYDPATDTWTQASDMPWARIAHSASVVDGKMCIIGGGNPKRRKSRIVHVYDPGTDTWTTAADRPARTGNHAAAVVDGKIYTIGGHLPSPAPPLSTVYEFDPGLPVVIPSVR